MVITSVINSKSPDVVVRIEKDGTEVQKTISFNEYRNACSNVAVGGTKVQRIGQLPAGFVDGGAYDGVQEAIIRVPKGKRPLNYLGKEYIIPYPDVVFYILTQEGSARITKVWFAGDDGELFCYPFGNVYEDARICWGQNVLPKVANMKELERFVEIFFSATTNNDLYHSVSVEIDGKTVQLTQRDYLEHVSKLDAFPMKWLLPFGSRIEHL